MNNSHQRILEDIVKLLRSDVAPALQDAALRAQVYSAVYLLENLRLRIDWSSEPARSQVQAQDALFAILREKAAAAGANASAPTGPRSGDWNTLRDEGDAIIAAMIRDAAIPAEAMGALRNCLRLQVEAEMRHTARAMFAEMASGKASPS